MTTNPTRPASGQVVATTWGLSVADTVVRRFANAASRDADLTGHTAADMLGQVCTLTDTGALLQYVGPVMGWRPPWNLPWGFVVVKELNTGLTGDGTLQTVATTAAFPVVAGRRYRVSAAVTMVSGTISAMIRPYLGATSLATFRANHPTPEGSVITGERFVTAGTTDPAAVATLRWQSVAPGQLAANADPGHWIAFEDVGPAVAAPTSLVDDGAGRLELGADDRARLEDAGGLVW